MVFSSLHFLFFFTPLFLVFWLILRKWPVWQAVSLLLASYIFYGWWSWKFLYILGGISLFTYLTGLLTGSLEKKPLRRMALLLGLTGNIGTLFIYKYFDFFVPALQSLFEMVHWRYNISILRLAVPVGLSFYIFLSVSYLIDIYRRNLTAEKNPLYFLLSVSFFPIILAGPINRPSNLIPQLKAKKTFDPELAADGLRQFLWGLFVKMVIADNCATFVDKVFADNTLQGSTLFYGAIFFTIQIYADFSSYSDMAIGLAKLFGIRLVRNFQFPYFARDISDFWKRWHISLTTWFRDYLFLPLAWFFSARIRSQRLLFIPSELLIYSISILITWTLTGFWHGANTTFLVWGIIHAIMLIIHQALRKPKKAILGKLNMKNDLLYLTLQRFYTLGFVVVAWVFFRSKTLPEALDYLDRTFTISLFSPPVGFPTVMILPITGFFFVEWFQRDKQHGLDLSGAMKTRFIRWAIYLFLISFIFFYQIKQQEFIYFNF